MRKRELVALRTVAAKGLKPAFIMCVTRFSLSDGTTFKDYRYRCEDLQSEFLDDCEPVRVYVYDDGVPVYAARQCYQPSLERLPKYVD